MIIAVCDWVSTDLYRIHLYNDCLVRPIRRQNGINGSNELWHVSNLGIRQFVPRATLLLDVPSRAKENGAHPQPLRRDDVVVDAVADHDARVGLNAQVFAGAEEEAHVGLAVAVRAAHLAMME